MPSVMAFVAILATFRLGLRGGCGFQRVRSFHSWPMTSMVIPSNRRFSLTARETVIQAEDLYKALKCAEEDKDGKIVLPEGMSFPVEGSKIDEKRTTPNNVLLVRQAHRDILEIVKSSMADVLFVTGPAGTGKSWCGMYILQALIKEGVSLVYENEFLRRTWVFRPDGKSRVVMNKLASLRSDSDLFPELLEPTTVHIFDANYEPWKSGSKLLILSSSNMNDDSFKQILRLSTLLTYPSLTRAEFDRYVKLFGVDDKLVEEVVKICGFGMVRALEMVAQDRSITSPKTLVDRAVSRFDIEKLSQYLTGERGADGEADPSTLIKVYQAKDALALPIRSRYARRNCVGEFASEYIKEAIMANYKAANQLNVLVRQLYYLALMTGYNRAVSVLAGELFEIAVPELISQSGLQCTHLPYTNDDPRPSFAIEPGMTVHHMYSTLKVEDMLSDCTDPNTLYDFGKNQPLFDAFVPPNTFIQFTNTLRATARGTHPLTLRTALKLCRLLPEQEVRLVLVVDQARDRFWQSAQSFIIDEEAVVDRIRVKEAGERKEKGEELGGQGSAGKEEELKEDGQRAFEKLDDETKKMLHNFKQFKALISMEE